MSGEMEDYKRSNHEDFCTSLELKGREFCGVRNNSITSTREIWILGEVVASMDIGVAERFPDLWDNLYRETFAI